MSYRTFRDFASIAEQQGLIRRVTKPVDPSWEPASMVKWAFQALSDEDRFGILFENVKGASLPLCSGALGASRKAYALALGIEPEEINPRWESALVNPLTPITVEKAPCQEVVLTGTDATLTDLPIPTWTPGKDAGPYLTTTVMTMEMGTGNQNTGVYRHKFWTATV